MPQYSFMPETKKLRISQKHLMRAIFMQIWKMEVIFDLWLKNMYIIWQAWNYIFSCSCDFDQFCSESTILQPSGAADERWWVLVCALDITQGLQGHAEPLKFLLLVCIRITRTCRTLKISTMYLDDNTCTAVLGTTVPTQHHGQRDSSGGTGRHLMVSACSCVAQ